MPAPVTADEFLELTRKSGLVEPQQLQAYQQRAGAAGGPRRLANILVRDGLLTRFQAEQLLQGRWRNFLLGGKYRVLGPLGSGGMGQVYLCEHQVMRRRVAVKVLPDRPARPAALERFRREARAVAQLDHPNIVGGHDIDQEDKMHFLVMEYVDGSTLHTIVNRRGPLDPLRAAHYVRQAALGLQHAHQAGLVHRDIKPSNLILDRTGTVKVLDLGLARFLHEQSDDLSRVQGERVLGTLEYMAPEQALSSHGADIRADIYGLGATFYFLLAGHGPFRNNVSYAQLVSPQGERPRPIRELRPDVPPDLAAVLERMMAWEPAERYQSPAEVAAALAPWTQTPIPPPPPQEMPELVALARDAGVAVGPGLPATLYDPIPSPTPSPRRPGAGPPSTGSGVATFPAPDTTGGSPATPVLSGPHMGSPAPPCAPPPPAAGQVGAAPGPGSQPAPPAGRVEEAGRPPSEPHKRRRWALLAGAAVLLLATGAVALLVYRITADRRTAAGPDNAAPPLRLLVPAYIYPAGDGLAQWDRVIDSPAAALTVAVANADNGPGKAVDPNYAKIIERARRKGVRVIGYVSTKYAARPLAEVRGEVDRWVRFYPGIGGIFLDEQASGADQILYYAALYEYARKDRGLSLVVTNPGTECAEEYVARPAADVVCLVEAAKGFSAYQPPAWKDRYPADRFAALLCKTGTPEEMKLTVRELRANRIGYGFITDAAMPNPWGRLPRYWEAELEAVQQANRR
jgi:serine/threonine protein kinase